MILGVACASSSEAPTPQATVSKGAGGSPGTAGTGTNTIPLGVAGGCVVTPDGSGMDAGADPVCAGMTTPVSFQRDVAQLVGCSGEVCHQPWSYATLSGHASTTCCDHRPLVLPGWPSESHLYQAITGVDSCVGRMGALSDAQVATVAAWICEGAPNN
jgi:hypothetical protein